jgi:hypothetical protein
MENFGRILPDESQLLKLEPRLTQIATPIFCLSSDEEFRFEFLAFLTKQADDHHKDRPQTIVAEAIRQIVFNERTWPVTRSIKDVAEKADEVAKDWDVEGASFTPRRTGTLVRGLGFETRRTGTGYQFTITRPKLDELVKTYDLQDVPTT